MQITIREPGSAFTHLIACLMTELAAVPLLVKAGLHGYGRSFTAMVVFIVSMFLLYSASTIYHSVNLSGKRLMPFKRVDHLMIFVLIAGSYTPICMVCLNNKAGYVLLGAIWSVAIVGMVVKAFWINCPKWFSSVLYIAMGWLCVFVFPQLKDSLAPAGFAWLFAGGIIYTIGGVIYALKLPLFNAAHTRFGSHEIFHLFVMGGSICHFICMYFYIL
jgi:hemolysin III